MTKTLKKLFERSRVRACGVGSGGIAVLFVLALVALAPQRAWGYVVMGSDRILLMNNSTYVSDFAVDGQGYYDTSANGKTYWEHSDETADYYWVLPGIHHVMYEGKGDSRRRLWELVNCRAGSMTGVVPYLNYIPWGNVTDSILKTGPLNSIPIPDEGYIAEGIGSVILLNTDEACIYSPVYDEGIGTIYFDAVNVHVENVNIQLDLQIATNTLDGINIRDVKDNSSTNINWQNIPFALFEVADAVSLKQNGSLTQVDAAATNLVLKSTEGGSKLFYRVRAQLNYYGPIRFRIRRTTKDTNLLLEGFMEYALVDNIIASYPPMNVILERCGEDYDKDLKGAEVLGCVGDLGNPFLTQGETNVPVRCGVRFIRNAGSSDASRVEEVSVFSRWRYLNQKVTSWEANVLDMATIYSDSSVSNFTEDVSLPLGLGVGDIEYYLVAKVYAPYYEVQDYATDGAVGYGKDWSEAITAITNRANYVDETPAGGHDYFVRIRESVSPFEYVKLCTSVATNKATASKSEDLLFRVEEPVRMELIGTNTWRHCYYVPTNMVGETISFHFEGRKLSPNPSNEFEFVSSDHVWRSDLETVPYLPYTSVAGESFTRDVMVTLDRAATHLIIEFNDELLSYSVSHGTYQNFNSWTDALKGYCGNLKYDASPTNSASATGVSDGKEKFSANMADWEIQGYSDPYWTENFNTSDTVLFPLYESFDTSPTPFSTGWEAGHGQWIRGARGSAKQAAAQEEVSLQMEGRGQGYIAFDKESNPPAGIGTVSFAARIAQAPRFDDFATFLDGNGLTNYAISAKLSMSRIYQAQLNPGDISPSQPSISLVARHRDTKGCYEYRVTRIASDQLECALYKWRPVSGRGMTATRIARNVITSLSGKQYTQADSGQTQIDNFNNMLVPGKADERANQWTSAYLFVFNETTTGPVRIKCMLSNSRNAYSLEEEHDNSSYGKQYVVLDYTDSDAPFLKGSYGVGSTDCNAGFGDIRIHAPVLTQNIEDVDIEYAGTSVGPEITAGDWAYYPDRWRQMTETSFGVGSLNVVMPSNQTVRLQFKEGDGSWFDSGYAHVITSFSTNFYTFAPCVSPDYKVRLITGGNTYDEVRTDVVVDDIAITSWCAKDAPTLTDTGTYGDAANWVYMAATVESSADITGPDAPSIIPAGTNGYALVFKTPGQPYKLIPKEDLVIDRLLLVGGGGAGGWTSGAGGVGGTVVEEDFSADPILLAKGSESTIIVGEGGDNYFVSGEAAEYWRAGGTGGVSSVSLKVDKATKFYSAAGGPGGAKGTEGESGAEGVDGPSSTITGSLAYYGGSGGKGGLGGGAGGKGGAGAGLDANAKVREGVDGEDGTGGGGGGGAYNPSGVEDNMHAGGRGGSGVVILRMRRSTSVCRLQPARGSTKSAMGLRSPYLEEGLSMLGFNYENAHSNCVLWLQVCTNDVIEGVGSMSASLTRQAPTTNAASWCTIETFAFTNSTPQELRSGTRTCYMSLRAPYRGFMRLVMAPEVMQYVEKNEGPGRDVDYGQITITGIYCYNEPALDDRSWWGWNFHAEGWNTEDKQYAYLFDSPEGLSGSLNFSAKASENQLTDKDTRGIGLSDPDLEQTYAENNSFVQCPPLTNGIGTVTFRARTFTTNQTVSSYITLFGSDDPDSYQVEEPDDWKVLKVFEITNTTYQTYGWATTDDSLKYYAVRLEVTGSRHGRYGDAAATNKTWETPPATPIQRVWIDEITASEPIVPRIVLRDVRPIRSGLSETVDPKPVTNVTDLSEQPILGESWGIQVRVEPQQMGDLLDESSFEVYAAFYRGISPWGYTAWSDKVTAVKLEKVSSNLVFRSTYNNASSIIGPDMTPNGIFPNNVWQYYVWVEYKDKEGVSHKHGLQAHEWSPPGWYYGIKDLNQKYGSGIGEKFAGYTILDSISPQRAWVNEVNISDNGTYTDGDHQYIEIAVPQGADIQDWRIDVVDSSVKRGSIAVFGYNGAGTTKKVGTKPGVDNVNHYTFMTLRSPITEEKGTCPEADGTWNRTPVAVKDEAYKDDLEGLAVYNGELRYYQPYGIELVRPSGIIEHQIVVQPTNTYEGLNREWVNAGTNLLAKILAADGRDSHWFFAGKDMTPATLGVFRSHGEDETCWTNRMDRTPGALNTMGNLKQVIDEDWFLQPNGTNVWICASVLGGHVHQRVGNNTNDSAVVIIRKGDSTNIVYTTDSWYQIGEVKTNDVVIAEARGRGSRRDTPAHTWTLQLKNVEETLTVTVDGERSVDLAEAGLEPNDPYYNAIMQWLSGKGDDDMGLYKARHWNLGNTDVGALGLKDMYWLDIDPTEPGWVLKAGMGSVATTQSATPAGEGASLAAATPARSRVSEPVVEPVVVSVAANRTGASLLDVSPTEPADTVQSYTNVRMSVTMMIMNTNDVANTLRAPDRIQGLEPGSTSYSPESGYVYDGSVNWTSATFKVCGALQKEGSENDFRPLRWFVFGPDSFDSEYKARIEISDPHSTASPAYYHGWYKYPELPVFYKWMLNADPAFYDTVEMLKADSTYQD